MLLAGTKANRATSGQCRRNHCINHQYAIKTYGEASCSGRPGVAVPSGVAVEGAGAGAPLLEVYVAAAGMTHGCYIAAFEGGFYFVAWCTASSRRCT